ncbi:MAG: DNA-processing protein DprA [Merdibacter sp.]
MRERILCYALRYHGEWNKIAKAIGRDEEWSPCACAYDFVTLGEPGYPKAFAALRFPPWIVFYRGDLSLLARSCVAVVGSRRASGEGIRACARTVEILSRRHVIVSGLAKGIDACAHRCALERGTIGVIGCGIDVVYPKENAALYARMARDHLIVSEYPPQTPPLAAHFPWRNRLIAAAGSALVVIEACRAAHDATVSEALSCPVRSIACPVFSSGSIRAMPCSSSRALPSCWTKMT